MLFRIMEASACSLDASSISRSKKRRQRRSKVSSTTKSVEPQVTLQSSQKVSVANEKAKRKKKRNKSKRPKLAEKTTDNHALRKVAGTTEKGENKTRPSATPKFESRKRPKFSYDDVESRLKAARFRKMNELYYTQSSADMVKYLTEHRSDFQAYHDSYQHQAALWPIRPVDHVINWLRRLPERLVIADFGCGEALVARAFPNRKVYSFDFVSVFRSSSTESGIEADRGPKRKRLEEANALSELVTECDMRNVPLANSSVDVAIFCLSLMNTNLVEFVCEAHRVLRVGGILKIVEIRSRFEKVGKFTHKVRKFGFESVTHSKDGDGENGDILCVTDSQGDAAQSDMFVALEFRKKDEMRDMHKQVTIARQSGKDVVTSVTWPAELTLRACLYKKR